MIKKTLCIIVGVMLAVTFTCGGSNAYAATKKKTAATNQKTTVKKATTTKKGVVAKATPKATATKPAAKASTTSAAKPKPKDINQKISETMNMCLNTDMFSGYALVSRNDSVIYEKGFGKADFKKGTTNSATMKYGIASITKQIVAVATMQLEEKGALKVGDYVNKYLPNFPYGDKITIQQLLTNTSGLPEQCLDFDITAYSPFSSKGTTKENDDKVKLAFEPGKAFLYSNTGYIILGYVVEKASGKPLDVYLKENIFDLLGLKNTGFNNEKNDLQNMATGYLNADKEEVGATLMDLNVGYVRGASGLYSTVEDLLKWETALNEKKLISEKSYEKIYTPCLNNYGYGWYINNENKAAPAYFHYGVTAAYRTYIYRRPSDKLVVIVISNYGDYDMSYIASQLDEAVK